MSLRPWYLLPDPAPAPQIAKTETIRVPTKVAFHIKRISDLRLDTHLVQVCCNIIVRFFPPNKDLSHIFRTPAYFSFRLGEIPFRFDQVDDRVKHDPEENVFMHTLRLEVTLPFSTPDTEDPRMQQGDSIFQQFPFDSPEISFTFELTTDRIPRDRDKQDIVELQFLPDFPPFVDLDGYQSSLFGVSHKRGVDMLPNFAINWLRTRYELVRGDATVRFVGGESVSSAGAVESDKKHKEPKVIRIRLYLGTVIS